MNRCKFIPAQPDSTIKIEFAVYEKGEVTIQCQIPKSDDPKKDINTCRNTAHLIFALISGQLYPTIKQGLNTVGESAGIQNMCNTILHQVNLLFQQQHKATENRLVVPPTLVFKRETR